MARVTRSEAIKNFLLASTHPDLASRYNADFEVQVNVAQDGGTRVEGDYKGRQWHAWTDGVQKWKSFRMPLNANSDPESNDGEMSYDLAEHAEGIGMTGWNWRQRKSYWVGFDFDAMTGHSERHAGRLLDAELQEVERKAQEIPWVTVRKSTSGKGLHLYVNLVPTDTANHNEHAALARAILGQMSALVGYDFQTKVDACVPADTWVQTDEGPQQVRKLIGRAVNVVVDGQIYQSTGFFATGEKQLFEIRTKSGYRVRATDNHPFLTSLGTWRQVKHLSIGDKLQLNCHKGLSWGGYGTWNEGYILGQLYGDGHFCSREHGLDYQHQLEFFPDDHCLVNFVVGLFKEHPNVKMNSAGAYEITSPELEKLRAEFGLTVDKVITEHLESCSSEFLSGFVSAIFDTDGGPDSEHTHIVLSQSNLPRLEAIQRILLRFGIRSRILKEREAGEMYIQGRLCKCEAKYTLTIGRENVLIFNERIGFQHPTKREKNRANINRILNRLYGKRKLARESFQDEIVSIVPLHTETVYDIRVPAIHAFDANGFVAHNCGGNMWIWHRKMKGTDGLTLLKSGELLMEVPPNWRDHIKVVTGKRRRNLPQFVETSPLKDEAERLFEELTGQQTQVPLDDDHKRLIDYLRDHNHCWWWDADHHMLVTHTAALRDAHEELSLKGPYSTLAGGTERGVDHNCFSGDSELLTEHGPMTFREAAVRGTVRGYVRTDRGFSWMDFEVRSFGRQKTVPIYFGDGSQVRATANHQWLYRDQNTKKVSLGARKFTYELIPDKTQLPLSPITLPEIEWEGYAHGFTYGDGWVDGDHCDVALFKYDVDLKKVLLRFGTLGSRRYEGHGYIDMVRNLPCHWKQLPRNPSRGYALGFVLGLAAADGDTGSSTRIFQSDFFALASISKLAIYAGLRVFPLRPYGDPDDEGKYENSQQSWVLRINNYNLTKEYFLRRDQRELFKQRIKSHCTTVSGIAWDVAESEEVFCAVVPVWGNFTLANGVNTSNCFLYPMRRGAWSVRRYTPGVAESATWDQDGAGWTRCYLNREPDLPAASKSHGAVEHKSGGFVFQHAEQAKAAALQLGANVELPHWALTRRAKMKGHKDGRLIVEVTREREDNPLDMKGWIAEDKTWHRVFNAQTSSPVSAEVGNYDDLIRHIVTQSGDDCGWVFRSDNSWRNEPLRHVQSALKSHGLSPKDSELVVGNSVARPWSLVNYPFQPEYPGDRMWNRGAAQFRFSPSMDHDNLNYPTWQKVLTHIGSGLDDAVKLSGWAKANGIQSGSDYLKVWIASLFQEPNQPLPYLFLYSKEQNTGKSILHEALERLVTGGYVRADNALTNTSNFNGELENAVICIVEETDLRKHKGAYNKIKDWVTSPLLPIHKKMQTPYSIPNTTHWIQCANDSNACPIFPGDTRITMIHVPPLDPTELIPKRQMLQLLEKEAADFMAAVLALEIPPSGDRLNVPTIATEEKLLAERGNRTTLETFIEENCHYVDGHTIKVSEFFDRFKDTLEQHELTLWTKIRVGREMPPQFPKGRNPKDGQWHFGNIGWEARKPGDTVLPKLVVRNEKLVPVTEATRIR